jgi:hypothetical protein
MGAPWEFHESSMRTMSCYISKKILRIYIMYILYKYKYECNTGMQLWLYLYYY